MERVIKWFITNTVAANMLMFIILVAGLLTLPRLKMEVFPDLAIDAITVSVPYPGSSPSDVEEGICFLIEENLQGLKGIKRITSLASENLGITTVEVLPGEDINEIQDKIKSRIDAIYNFPVDAEKPIIQNITQTSDVITVAVSGDVDEESLVSISDRIKELGLAEDLRSLKGLTPGMLMTLGEQKILTLEDFADLASDELTGGFDVVKGERVKIHGYLEDFALSKTEADELIMSARNIVYKD